MEQSTFSNKEKTKLQMFSFISDISRICEDNLEMVESLRDKYDMQGLSEIRLNDIERVSLMYRQALGKVLLKLDEEINEVPSEDYIDFLSIFLITISVMGIEVIFEMVSLEDERVKFTPCHNIDSFI